ncbi:MAG: hypothetical protein LUQ42_01085, partial [Methanomicrobiales archaeon]|nr:hypothetical protein [Methanomicrobiales archaeon]
LIPHIFLFRFGLLPCMPSCGECFFFRPAGKDQGECQLHGPVEAGRDAGRCPSRTFRPRK